MLGKDGEVRHEEGRKELGKDGEVRHGEGRKES